MIKKVDAHSSQLIYTRSVEKPEKPAGGAKAEGAPAKGKGGDQKGKQQPKNKHSTIWEDAMVQPMGASRPS